MGLCGGFSAEVRAKKMRQDGSAEFISVSLDQLATALIAGGLKNVTNTYEKSRDTA